MAHGPGSKQRIDPEQDTLALQTASLESQPLQHQHQNQSQNQNMLQPRPEHQQIKEPVQESSAQVHDENPQSGALKRQADEKAGLFSRIFFVWFYPVLWLGVKGEISEENLGALASQDEPVHVRDKFQDLWGNAKRGADGKRPLRRVVFNLIGWKVWLRCFLYTLVNATLLTILPFVSKALIDSFSEGPTIGLAEKVGYIIMLSLFPLLASMCESQLNFTGKRASLCLYEAFTMAIYNKSLRLSSAARAQTSTGQTVTMMSTDAGSSLERVFFVLFPMMIGELSCIGMSVRVMRFVAPVQMVVILYLLFSLLGVSFVAGIVIIALAIPLNIKMFVKIGVAFRSIMTKTDARMKLVNELINGIRIIKSYAWEIPFLENLTKTRNDEVKYIRQHAYYFSLGVSSSFLQLPLIIQVGIFLTYYLTGGNMEPGIVFTALQLFQLLQQVLSQIPMAINQVVSFAIALNRIRDYLELEELERDPKDVIELFDGPESDVQSSQPVVLNNASFSWGVRLDDDDESERSSVSTEKSKASRKKKAKGKGGKELKVDPESKPDIGEHMGAPIVLENISLALGRSERVALYGAVGEGKSSLLMAMLGELEKRGGNIRVKGSVSYASQRPWIINATIKDNILFGLPYEERRYRKVIAACSLLDDIKLFTHGDMTMIGERGINLSGGQQARIGLARAVYNNASIVLLDDPLAAVDAHVGEHIFKHCIMSELLDDKLVVLVTNKVQLLKSLHRVIILKDKTIVANGTYSDIIEKHSDLLQLSGEEHKSDSDRDSPVELEEDGLIKSKRQNSLELKADEYFNEIENGNGSDVLYEEESKEVGSVKWSVYKYYFQAVGYKLAIATIVLNVIYLSTPLVSQYVLSFWSNEALCEANDNTVPGQDCSNLRGQDFWMVLYVSTFAVGFVCCLVAAALFAESRVIGVRVLHERLASTVFAAPISFFDVTPVGRILNRFSKDMNIVDTQLTVMLMFAMVTLMYSITSFVAIILGTRGIFLIVLVPVLFIYYKIFSLSRRAAIRLQRIEATTRGPIYSRFSELLTGLTTVRAYNKSKDFQTANEAALRRNVLPFFLARCTLPAWLMISLNVLGVIITATVATTVVVSEEVQFLTAGEAGLALTFSLAITTTLYRMVFVLTEVEVQMNAVERIKGYIETIPREEENVLTRGQLPALTSWPRSGKIEFSEYTTGYRQGPDVLKKLTFTIEDKEKVGIVGRTGSGKSTTILALLRVVNARSGSISIDGTNIADIGLVQLRKALGLIPQNPVCFIGSIRYNLDPFREHSDDFIWQCLDQVQLKSFVDGLPGKLEYMIQESGENISVGQRQLLCIARALLRDTKVLMLDEATASVDKETDALLQTAIRKCFKDRTVLTIAHRLETILDSDRVLVLEKGCVAEFDTPAKLVARQDGIFSGMVRASNNSSDASLVARAVE